MTDDRDPAYFVKSAEKTLAVLLAFRATQPRLTVTQVAEATDLTRAAARRFLLTLVDLGYVATDGPSFELTPRVLDFGAGFLAGLDLPKIAHPHLTALAHRLDESATLSVLDGDEVVYIARVAAPRLHSVTVNVGRRLPAWATSMGRVLIAALPEEARAALLDRVQVQPFTDHTISTSAELRAEIARVGAQGWSFVSQELDDGLRGLAVPVRRGADVLAALNISVHASHLRGASVDELVPDLLACAEAIGADYGGRALI
ncbi:IclR family transcriptional regulator domain-containing protein [Microbacterium gilvum]|uniref:IclR family transcriptional regulator C-terminal domain-containing protein n=1 Tax=Microbacterium gilvum TaxID=1336204 RepID=A0ABP9AFV8_9MICO